MWKVGCTRSGGPRFCTDRSEAETLDRLVKHSRKRGRWGEEERKKVQGTFFPPNRPTRHDHAEETLDLGFKGLLGINQKDSGFNLSLLILCGRWDLKKFYYIKTTKRKASSTSLSIKCSSRCSTILI